MDKQHTKRVRKKRNAEKSIKFRCDYSSTPLKVLESRGWTRIYDPKDRRWDLWWCDSSEIKLALDNLQRLRAHQRVAHFLNHGELTRKNLLYRNLRRYKRLLLKTGKTREAELCDIMPVSFELPSEYRMLVEEYRKCQGSTWIVKPAAGSQGRGIFLFQRLKDLADWRSKEYPTPSADISSDNESLVPPDIYIVQKYIDDPYLLGGCKFDMRIYVLVTSFQPLKVWLAREGFARLSGEQFSLERINDSRVHLTNMSIQLRQQRDYEQASPPVKLGSKWPLSSLRQYLTDRHGPAVVDDLLHNIAGALLLLPTWNMKMAEITLCDGDKSTCIPINVNGNIFLSCLKTHFPTAGGLSYEDKQGKIQNLKVTSEEVILKAKVKRYNVRYSNEASDIGKTSAVKIIGENGNKQDKPKDRNTETTYSEENCKSIGSHDSAEKPTKVKTIVKTLRIGWLNKSAGGRKYRKVPKPRGSVKKLKLDASVSYSAEQIKRMAIEVFEASGNNSGDHCSAIEYDYVVNLGDYGGQAIVEFKRKDGQSCDIWEYCKEKGKRLFQLNLFMLTSPIEEQDEDHCHRTISTRRTKARPKIVNEVRVLYEYTRRSRYSCEFSYMECDKPELYSRLFEDQCGNFPPIEQFEPSEHGYSISRIVKSGQVLLQISADDRGARSVQLPGSSLEDHVIVHDVDQLQGYCNRKFGIGFVPSCSYECQPVFSWYKDGTLFRKHEYLYWLHDVKDHQSHLWTCIVSCTTTQTQLKSKEILVDALL